MTPFLKQSLLFIISLSLVYATIPSSTQAQTFVNLHNCYRATVDPPAQSMPNIIWNSTLANSSNAWATLCRWAHSGTPGVGENLYAVTIRTNVSNFDPRYSVNAWGAEKSDYIYSTNTCTSGRVCGHYTQMIWANSNQLGCAFQDCPVIQGIPWPNGGTIVVCEYWPPGNVYNQKPYLSV